MPDMADSGFMDEHASDIVLVGGGLSAACVVYGFLQRLLAVPALNEPLKITVFEETGNLWTGVPYGDFARTDFFLIETLEETRCPLFESWIKNHPKEIASYALNSSPVVKQWYCQNKVRIENGDIKSLYFPRRLFGHFMRKLLDELISRAEGTGVLSLRWVRQEVIDIEQEGRKQFRLVTDQQDTFFSARVIIAIGSIPQNRPFNIPDALALDSNYISDREVCACFDLDNRLRQSLKGFDSRRATLAIIGSAASALETVFFIRENRILKEKIGQILVISTSGRLIGGIHAEDYCERDLPEYVQLRKSSDIYISAAQKLYAEGLLKVVKAKVAGVEKRNGMFELRLSREECQIRCTADVIINCTGSGSVDNTTSTLVNNLRRKLPVNDERRGFSVNNQNEVDLHPGLFVVGPLLNRSFAGKQVESISAVFREGDRVAEALAVNLPADSAKFNVGRESAVL